MAARKIRNAWWVDFRHAGERYRKRSPESSKTGAMAYEAVLRQQLARKGSLEDTGSTVEMPTFAAFAKEWLETYVRTNNKPSEQETKETILRCHLVPYFGLEKINEIKQQDIERYKASKQGSLSQKTINNHLICLNKCLHTAVEWGRMPIAPKIGLLRVPTQKFDYLSPLETAKILEDKAEPTWNEMVRLAARTGMRRGELIALDWSDVDFSRRTLTVRRAYAGGEIGTPKNHRERTIPLTDDVFAMLYARAEKTGLVFHGLNGEILGKSINGGAIKRVCKRVGLRPIGWHTLRHTYASTLVSEGIPLTAVSQLLGHSDIRVTMRYAHLAPSMLHESVRALQRAEDRELEKFGQQAVNAYKKEDVKTSVPNVLSLIPALNPNKNLPVMERSLLVQRLGFEPRTLGLRGPCSTN